MFWLSTVRRDGRPHVTPLPAIWLDGTLHFCAGSHEQKAKNLESNPRCILTTGTSHLRSGLDVVVEGTAARVTDTAQLQRLAVMWKSKLDWDFEVTGRWRNLQHITASPSKISDIARATLVLTQFEYGHTN